MRISDWSSDVCSSDLEGDRAVPRRFVEAHGEAALRGSDEVDLHDHRRGPGEALVHAEQHVGDDDPRPARCPDEDEGNGDADEPAAEEDGLAAESNRAGAGEDVRPRLDTAAGGEEGEGDGAAGTPTLFPHVLGRKT